MSNQTYATGLTKVNDTFLPMIQDQLVSNGINMDQYSKQCVMNALSAINATLDSKSITFSDPSLDRNNITTILLNIAALKLNAAASPREVFFTLRNVKTSKKDDQGKDIWKKQIEMGIEGDGNDAILSNFGRNVEQVRPFWLVREGDDFEYPSFNGLDMSPPKWTPKGKGDVIRVVYPIIFNDKSIQYFISERDDVAKNLVAHINNSMMNETFGILPAGKKRFDASPDQAKKIAAKKAEYLKKAAELGLGALDDPELQQWISPAWSEYQSRESMLIRKMRNNVVKKIPKDFGNAFVEMIHDQAADGEYGSVREEVNERANRQFIDIELGQDASSPSSYDEGSEDEQPVSDPAQQDSGKIGPEPEAPTTKAESGQADPSAAANDEF